MALQAWRGYGQPVVVVRPFNHVGPGQAPTFAVLGPGPPHRRGPPGRRQPTLPVGTLDHPAGLHRRPRRGPRLPPRWSTGGEPGSVYNVCSGHDVAVAEVAARLLALAGTDLELVTDPSLVRPVDVPVLRGDPARLEAATGWKPEIPLDDTLADVLAYWEERAGG